MIDAIAIVLMFILPVAVIKLFKTNHVLVCYILGFAISFIPVGYDKELVQTVASVIVAIAIPLILFSFNLSAIKALPSKFIKAFTLMILSVIAVSAVSCLIFNASGLENSSAFAGMAIGLYVGGTPNLFAVGTALLDDVDLINIANISDVLLGAFLFLCIITFLKNVYQKDSSKVYGYDKEGVSVSDYDFSFLREANPLKLSGVILLSLLCFGIGVALEYFINGNLNGSLFIIVSVSVLGILFSFIKSVRGTEGSYHIGQYFVLVFTTGLSMSLNLSVLKAQMLPVFLFFGCVQFSSLLLHLILCRLFKIDGGTALITCVAGIYGPPFITPVANSLKDKSLIVPGIVCGVFGLAFGNLIGIGIGSLLGIIL